MDVDNVNHGRHKLAQELLDSILDHLHYDLESLKQSALASKSLLPTCQRHLFSTFQITKSNINELLDLFSFLPRTNKHNQDPGLPANLKDLLNTYTTDLILDETFGIVGGKTHLPEFKNVEKIVFKGTKFDNAVMIPSFLERTCFSPYSKLRSVEFDFRRTYEKAILESLYLLPATVEDVTFTSVRNIYSGPDWDADSVRGGTRHKLLRIRTPGGYHPGVHHFNGTLKLRLGPLHAHERLLSTMLELDDLFKFDLKRINYTLGDRASIRHFASLVNECKDTLQFLDILVSAPGYHEWNVDLRSFDFSHHHALRSVRIWTSVTFHPDWLCEAISTIPRSSSTNPRVSPLRIELHISLPGWMRDPAREQYRRPNDPDKVITPWIALDTQLLQLTGLDPDKLSTVSVADAAAAGILLDITVPDLTKGPEKGIASLIFPQLSSIKGVVRLV